MTPSNVVVAPEGCARPGLPWQGGTGKSIPELEVFLLIASVAKYFVDPVGSGEV